MCLSFEASIKVGIGRFKLCQLPKTCCIVDSISLAANAPLSCDKLSEKLRRRDRGLEDVRIYSFHIWGIIGI